MQDILEGEVEDITEGNNVDFEDDIDLQDETRSVNSTGDSTNIGDPMMPKNTGGDAERSKDQSRTTATTTTTQKKIQGKPNQRDIQRITQWRMM